MITVIGVCLLPLDALRVLLRHEREHASALLGQIQRVHEAQPLERLVLARSARSRRARCSAPRCSTAAA